MTEAFPRGRIQACIFDLDGVLVDTARLHFQAWRRLARSLGYELDESVNERVKGVSRMASLDIVLAAGGIELPEPDKATLAERKNDWYRESLAGLSPRDLLVGAEAFLEGCRGLGLKVALASASASANDVLRSTGIGGFFDAIVDGTDEPEPKPSPDIFLRAARKLAVESPASIVFEDAAAGIAGAKAAGMLAVGIGSPELLGAADLVMPGFAGVDAAALIAELAELGSGR